MRTSWVETRPLCYTAANSSVRNQKAGSRAKQITRLPLTAAQASGSTPAPQPESEPALHLACSLRALADTREVEAFAYFRVAADLWPDVVVGPAALYIRYLQRVWEAARAPVDGVMLTRVLAEEGVIGGRSVKGRQGPIVGNAPKRTRPLNAVEIETNWDILRDTCAVKHGLFEESDRADVRAAVATALGQAMRGVDGVPMAAPHAYASVLQAVSASSSKLCVLSPYPEPLTRAVLACCGYEADSAHITSPAAVQSSGDLIVPGSSSAQPQIHVIIDSYPALRSLKGRLLGKGSSAAFRQTLQSQWAEDSGEAASSVRGEDPSHAVKLHMCDWALRSPAMKAQASADAAMHVLTDVGLAELLRVEDVDEVMDGVRWR